MPYGEHRVKVPRVVEVKEWTARSVPTGSDLPEIWREAVSDALPVTAARPRMTYAEFLDWADEDTLAEWVEGEVVMSSPASCKHQDIGDFLASVLRIFVEQHDLGTIITAPFQMKLARSGREPDVLFIRRENLARLRETYLDGPADVAVEIISQESMRRDREEKFAEYEAGGVPEYWLIDPLREWAEFYRVDDTGEYAEILGGREGVYRSEVLTGFWLRVEWLWQTPLSNPIRVLGDIAGVEPEVVENFLQALVGES